MSNPISMLLSPGQNPLWLNILLVLLTAVPIWLAGGRMSRAADTIGSKTGLGASAAGVLVLAVATSLPDIATTTTAALIGDIELAVAALMGSIALQVAVLAVADAASRGSITFQNPEPETLLQSGILVFLLGMVILLVGSGVNPTVGPVGVGSVLLLVGYLVGLFLSKQAESRAGWRAKELPEGHGAESQTWSLRTAGWVLVWTSLIALLAGVVLARSASAAAEQSGLGSIVVGVTLVAAVTSVPEISTTVSAARRGSESLAFSGILGTNSLNVALLFVVDLAYAEGAALSLPGPEALFLAALAIVLTSIYLIGLLFRVRWTWLSMGPDSLAALVVYLGGIALLVYSSVTS